MNEGFWIGLFIYLFVAAILIGMGIFQVKSRNPVGFYSGETPPAKEELTDVAARKGKHGTMWIVYGTVVVVSYFISGLSGDGVWMVVLAVLGVLLPLPVMIWYHHRLCRIYKK